MSRFTPPAFTPPASSIINRDNREHEPVDIAIVCEGTYPYVRGGLAAVVHQLCTGMPHLRIGIIHLTWDKDSPNSLKYDLPENVAWVLPIYQATARHDAAFSDAHPREAARTRFGRRRLTKRLMAAFDAHMNGSDAELWALYDEGINPLTRRFNLWGLIGSQEFMELATVQFASADTSLTDLFWQLRDFASLAYAAMSVEFPKAQIYHAHTTGLAGLVAAAAARQHNAKFLLTEHNLYVRDAVNNLLNRPVGSAVTASDWKSLETYEDKEGLLRKPTSRDRSWMAWFTRLGSLAYRAADQVTYLHTGAVSDASLLGGLSSKSILIPNGVEIAPFMASRAVFDKRALSRRSLLARGGDYTWRFAFVGRVVPLKGVTELLHALAAVRGMGITNFTLDICGPDDEDPTYAAECVTLAAKLGLNKIVKFRGPVDIPAELGSFDALLMPSHTEGLPIALLEAMAVGLPSIVTDVGANFAVVAAPVFSDISHEANDQPIGPTGLVVPPRDKAALTNAIASLIMTPERFEAFSLNARRRVDEIYSLNLVLEAYARVYAALGVENANVFASEISNVSTVSISDSVRQLEIPADNHNLVTT